MNVYQPTYNDKKTGQSKTVDKWWVRFDYHAPDGQLQRAKVPGFSSRKLTVDMGNNIAKLVNCREAGSDPDPTLARWVEAMAPDLREKLAKMGIVSAASLASRTPLLTLLPDYIQSKRVANFKPRYIAGVENKIKRMMTECGFTFWSDVTVQKIEAFLCTLKGKAHTGKIRTCNDYVVAITAFANWCVDTGKIPASPIASMRVAKITDETERRAMAIEEATWLLSHVEKCPVRRGTTGHDRAMVYRFCMETGLRAEETYVLTRGAFDLNDTAPVVYGKKSQTKNKDGACIDLSHELAAMLREYLGSKLPTAPAFRMTKSTITAEIFKKDAESARKAWVAGASTPAEKEEREKSDFLAEVNHRGQKLVFHSLRHTYGTNLFQHARCNTPEVMQLMRVKDERIVRRYTKGYKVNGRAVADRMPSLSSASAAAPAMTIASVKTA